MLNPSHKQAQLARGLLNKDPTIWITGTNPPTPASQPPWYGLHPGFVWHSHPSKFFKLINFIYALLSQFLSYKNVTT